MIGENKVAHFEEVCAVHAKFRELPFRLDLRFREAPAIGLSEPFRFRETGSQLDGGVAVLFFRPLAHDLTAIQLQDRDRYVPPVFEKKTGHADLLRDDARAHPRILRV